MTECWWANELFSELNLHIPELRIVSRTRLIGYGGVRCVMNLSGDYLWKLMIASWLSWRIGTIYGTTRMAGALAERLWANWKVKIAGREANGAADKLASKARKRPWCWERFDAIPLFPCTLV
ncbi:hypothetical protein QQ045_028028 [Rhodiola kirilowii]